MVVVQFLPEKVSEKIGIERPDAGLGLAIPNSGMQAC
jgi:hypothetical protein